MKAKYLPRNRILFLVLGFAVGHVFAGNDLPSSCKLLDAPTAKSILRMEVGALNELAERSLENRSSDSIRSGQELIFSNCGRSASLSGEFAPIVVLTITKYLDKKKGAEKIATMQAKFLKEPGFELIKLGDMTIYRQVSEEAGARSYEKFSATYVMQKDSVVVVIKKGGYPEEWQAKLGKEAVADLMQRVFTLI